MSSVIAIVFMVIIIIIVMVVIVIVMLLLEKCLALARCGGEDEACACGVVAGLVLVAITNIMTTI